eukprot:scaffold1629_cov369-Prasinococcus_capsulatus_cf.AAC.20
MAWDQWSGGRGPPRSSDHDKRYWFAIAHKDDLRKTPARGLGAQLTLERSVRIQTLSIAGMQSSEAGRSSSSAAARDKAPLPKMGGGTASDAVLYGRVARQLMRAVVLLSRSLAASTYIASGGRSERAMSSATSVPGVYHLPSSRVIMRAGDTKMSSNPSSSRNCGASSEPTHTMVLPLPDMNTAPNLPRDVASRRCS